jgi:hypothetical protein
MHPCSCRQLCNTVTVGAAAHRPDAPAWLKEREPSTAAQPLPKAAWLHVTPEPSPHYTHNDCMEHRHSVRPSAAPLPHFLRPQHMSDMYQTSELSAQRVRARMPDDLAWCIPCMMCSLWQGTAKQGSTTPPFQCWHCWHHTWNKCNTSTVSIGSALTAQYGMPTSVHPCCCLFI